MSILLNAIKNAKITETLENYSVSDKTKSIKSSTKTKEIKEIRHEEGFWRHLFYEPEKYWNKYFSLSRSALSFWVPRVPGLFFARGSKVFREIGWQHQAGTKKEFIRKLELEPLGKSGVVMGGIGTFLFPPDENGNHLATLSLSYNVSAGIPALISPEVVDGLKLKEGDLLSIKKAKWSKMSIEWAKRFPSIKEIKRGYFLLDDPKDIEVIGRKKNLLIHPCSIMEYEVDESILYDYCFCSVDSKEKKYRKSISDFFEYYRKKNKRNGQYLISADIADPLFDSRYASPQDLREDEAGLSLIKHRINEFLIDGKTIDEIQNAILKKYNTVADLKFLITQLALPSRLLVGNKPNTIVQGIINHCIEHKKIDELVDFLTVM